MKANHAYKDKAKSALRAKRAAAGVLAAAVLLAQAMPAYAAVTYYTANGTVYVEQKDSDNTPASWQGDGQRPENDEGVSHEKEIYIYGGSEPAQESGAGTVTEENLTQETKETEPQQPQEPPEQTQPGTPQETPTADRIVQVGDGVQGVAIYIEDVNTSGTTDAAIAIGESTDAKLYITDTKIEKAEGDGIAIGAGSDVDITFKGENTYSAAKDAEDKYDTAGIRIGIELPETEAAPQAEETQAEETGEAKQEDAAIEEEQEKGDRVTMVTITGTADDMGAASFTVTNADAGIYVEQNSEAVITGGGSTKKSESEESRESEQGEQPQTADGALELTLTDNKVGVENHGTLTVTGGTEAEITHSDKAALYATDSSTTTLEGKASITINKRGETMLENSATLTVEDATLTARKVSLDNGAVMAIGSNAKVEANQIVDLSTTSVSKKASWLVITGGTLELTGSKSERTLDNTMQPGLNADHMETLYTNVQNSNKECVIWPTNGAAHGNDKLVNFQLTADEAHSLFDVIDRMGKTYSYYVDRSKYEEGETLSVWVPAVLLDYYYRDDLPEGTSFEGMTEDEVLELLKTTQYRGGLQDAVIRGQSIQFATLKGYTTGNTDEAGKTWYYYCTTPAEDVEDGTVKDDAAEQTDQWRVFGADTTVTALERQKLYAFSSEHFGEENDKKTVEPWENDDLDDDLDVGVSSQMLGTLGTFGILGGNRGSTSATASLAEIGAKPNQTEPERQNDTETAEPISSAETPDGKGELHDTAAYASAGGKTGDETPLWVICALLAVCGLAVPAWRGPKRRVPCRH